MPILTSTLAPTRLAAIAPLAVAAAFVTSALAAPSGEKQAADPCIAAPNSPAPQGKHWYYRTDRAKQRKCWYLADAGKKVQAVPQSSASASPPAQAEAGSANRGLHAPRHRQVNRAIFGADSEADRTPVGSISTLTAPDVQAAPPAFGLRQPAPSPAAAPVETEASTAPAQFEAPSPSEPATQDAARPDRPLSAYPVVATPDATAAFEPAARTQEPAPAPVTTEATAAAAPVSASGASADDTTVQAGMPTHVLLLLAGALAAAAIVGHAIYRMVAERRRRVRIDQREVVWNSVYEQPNVNFGVPANEATPHDDVERTLQEILRACGHRAA
jgi:hypothetical protein